MRGATFVITSALVGWVAWHTSSRWTRLGRARSDMVTAQGVVDDRRKLIKELVRALVFVGFCVLLAAVIFAAVTGH